MPIVSTPVGRFEGRREGSLAVFRGIPYATPPIGPLRWRPPKPAPAFTGVHDASAFGPVCLQKPGPREPETGLKDRPQGEDCLTLNIWAPGDTADGPLPVMVWIHGGRFLFGAGSLSTYNGSALARRGAIVVTLNYRLGLFGTFAHPSLREEGVPDGNYGLLDVIAVLRWVRDNITAFGGNPEAVTLFGESAGGVTVGYLMASPLATGLFHRAIIQSGALSLPEYTRAQAAAERIADGLGVRTAEALRALPASALRDVEAASADTMPFIDGMIIREKARAAFEAGRIHAVPLLIGMNDAETGFFGPRYWQSLPSEIGADRWSDLRALCFGYGTRDEATAAQQVSSELFAGLNSRAFARGASAVAPVHAYRFAWVLLEDRASQPGAIHTAEIPYVFGHVAEDAGADARSRQVSRALADRWVAFASTGDPQRERGDWPRFEAAREETLLLVSPEGESLGPNPADGLLDRLDAMTLPPRP